MILIFGGAYQGKLEYARENFNKNERCDCSQGAEPDLSKPMIYGLQGFVMSCTKAGTEAADWLRAHRDELQDKIVICDDVSQGVVSMDPTVRAFREMNGRTLIYLAKEADQVIRVFCGLGKRIK